MAASAAQAAEQVALNAHITLRELKGMIDTVVEKNGAFACRYGSSGRASVQPTQ